MIITKLAGGLGNQLFQYAIGRSQAERLGVPLKIDTEHHVTDVKREYGLKHFNITAPIATSDEIRKLKHDSFLDTVVYKIFGKKNTSVCFEYDYKKFHPQALTISDNTYLAGFWQKESYFKNIREILLRELTLKDPFPEKASALVKKIKNTNSVSIHIRRGDYVLPKYQKVFHQCSPEYFYTAVDMIKEKVSNPHFFVFSNEIEWTKTLNFPENTTYVDDAAFDLEHYHDLVLMSQCKHNIIANSTFSWWGAWLNQNPDKIVIAPKRWFTEESPTDVVPESWIRI